MIELCITDECLHDFSYFFTIILIVGTTCVSKENTSKGCIQVRARKPLKLVPREIHLENILLEHLPSEFKKNQFKKGHSEDIHNDTT